MPSSVICYQKSDENLKASRVCFEKNLFNASVSRSYYSCAQAVAGFLEDHDQLPDRISHVAIIRNFSKLWREKRRNNPDLAKSLKELYDARQEADYGNSNSTRKEATVFRAQASDFINILKQREGIA